MIRALIALGALFWILVASSHDRALLVIVVTIEVIGVVGAVWLGWWMHTWAERAWRR